MENVQTVSGTLLRQKHINLLQLKAAFMGLQGFAGLSNLRSFVWVSNREILLRIDNMTAISNINRYIYIIYIGINDMSRMD